MMTATNSDRTRFFIALLPPQLVQEEANSLIRELSDRYRTRTAKAPPHITIQAPFLWDPANIADLTTSLHAFTQTQPAIPVGLQGFGAFPPRVLFINVLKTPELLKLQTALLLHLEQTLDIVDPVAKRRPFAPHLTLASRNLTRQTFQQARADLELRSFEFQFVSDRLTLLIHDGQRWQIHSEYACTSKQ